MDAEQCLDRMAERLRRWRGESGLTLQQVADRSGVAASTIHKIELRKTIPTVSVLFKIAQGLGRPVTDFMEDDPEPEGRVQSPTGPAKQLGPGLRVARVGEPGAGPNGYRLWLGADGHSISLRFEGNVLVTCESGQVRLRSGRHQWRLLSGDLLPLRSRAGFRIVARADDDARLLVLGRLPDRPALLVGREPQREASTARAAPSPGA